MFEHKNAQNGTILRDVFIFWTWQHPKRSNSTRLLHFRSKRHQKRRILRDALQKWKVECRADRLVPMRFADFPVHLSKVLRLPRKIDARSYEVLRLSCKIILANLHIWYSKMQPLSGNQRPDFLTSLMNMSFVLCLPRKCIFADPLQMSHACHHSWKCYKTLTFWSLLTRCTIPLRLPRETTSEPPKVARTCGVLHILTWKCPSRHNGMHFFDIRTSKCGPNPWCF